MRKTYRRRSGVGLSGAYQAKSGGSFEKCLERQIGNRENRLVETEDERRTRGFRKHLISPCRRGQRVLEEKLNSLVKFTGFVD